MCRSIPRKTAKQETESQSSFFSCFTVDINPETKPDLVADAQKLEGVPDEYSIDGDVILHIMREQQRKCMKQIYLVL